MHPIRKQRLLLVLAIVVVSGLAVSLLTYALRGNMNLFYPPSKILAGEAPVGKTIRAGGCVVPGSIDKASDSLKVTFDITDGAGVLPISYEGILPDLFGEGEAAVLTGQLQQSGSFQATEVLAKHDETYMPPEVSDTLQGDQGDNQSGYQASNAEDHAASCEDMFRSRL